MKEQRQAHKNKYKAQLAEIKAKLKAEKKEKDKVEQMEMARKRRVKANALKKITQEKILVKTTGLDDVSWLETLRL